jgi:hypothetical protein
LAVPKVGAKFLCFANKRHLYEVTQGVEVMALEVILRRGWRVELRNDALREAENV